MHALVREAGRRSTVRAVFAAALACALALFARAEENALPEGAIARIGLPPGSDASDDGPRLPGVRTLAFSIDGRQVAVCGEPEDPSEPRRVIVFDARDGKSLLELETHAALVVSLEFSPDGKRLLAAAADHPQGVRVWEVPSGRLLRSLPGGHGDARFVEGGARVAIAEPLGAIDAVRVYDVATGNEVGRFPTEVSYRRSIGRDGTALLGVRSLQARTVEVFDLPNNRKAAKLPGSRETPAGPTMSPDGRTVAAIDGDDIIVWELTTEAIVHRLWGHSGRVLRLAFSPDGQRLASGSADRTARVWELATGRELHRFEAHRSIVSAVEFSGDGRRLATGSLDRAAFVWDLDHTRRTFLAREPLDDAALAAVWHELASADSAAAYRALGVAALHPERAMGELDQRVDALLVPIRGENIDRLIAELGHESYIVRQRATLALRKLREAARPALLQALRTSDSVEIRERAHRILSESGAAARFSAADIRRMRRIIHAAGIVGDAAARRVLARLASDFPIDDVRRDAERTSKSLDGRERP
ncbi:MAG: WD40 repeat domain-containing protein [Planctomycetaceae bacterium]